MSKKSGYPMKGGGKDSRNPFFSAQDDAEEDLPPMRHVKLSTGPKLRGVEPIPLQKPGWVVGPPPPQITRPTFPGKPPVGLSKANSFSMKKEWSSNIRIPSNWVVRPGDLEKVPIDFPLERTHREIHEDAAVVSSRISEALRKLSVEAEYDDEKAKAKCRTSDFVSFRIRLYDGGENGMPVVVELQRRNGPAMSFLRTCKAILRAADGTEVTDKTMAKKGPPAFKVPGGVAGMKCLQGVALKPSSGADALSELAKACDMLRSEKRDINLLAMQSLCILTDPLKTSPNLAMEAASAVVVGGDKAGVRNEIMEMRGRYLAEAEVKDGDEEGVDLFLEIHHKMLVAFSNSLTLTTKTSKLERAVTEQEWFKGFLIPLLTNELKQAKTSLNNAYVAAVGVGCLAKCCPVSKDLVLEICGLDTLKAANDIGKDYHELLAHETSRCISSLEASP